MADQTADRGVAQHTAKPATTRETRRLRRILTPEGVELQVELADAGERAAAFLIDIVAMNVAIVALVLIGVLLMWQAEITVGRNHLAGWLIAFGIVLVFAIRTFYFSWFELRWTGSTPGKRLLGIRVIDRQGGPLTGQAVVARNLTREIEFFLPAVLVLAGPALLPAEQWIRLSMLVWLGIFVLMPLFNRDRLRVGDMIGGTWVIVAPKAKLLADLGSEESNRWRRAIAGAGTKVGFTFTPQQLDIYGAYELQALEALLRRQDTAASGTRGEVAQRIIRRIDWQGTLNPQDVDEFLNNFYLAQRRRLEGQMLFGKRRKDKHDRGDT